MSFNFPDDLVKRKVSRKGPTGPASSSQFLATRVLTSAELGTTPLPSHKPKGVGQHTAIFANTKRQVVEDDESKESTDNSALGLISSAFGIASESVIAEASTILSHYLPSVGPEVSSTVSSANVQAHSTQTLDSTRVYKEMLELRTGEDAIAFFLKHGSSNPIKFVYAVRKFPPSNDTFKPYELIVVPPNAVGTDYFTISESGVTHFSPGEPTEFLSLSDWMRDHSAFNICTSLGFFKHFLHRKMFGTWRTNVRYSRFCKQRYNVHVRLFSWKEAFLRSFQEIQGCLGQMERVNLLDLTPGRRSLAQFAAAQSNARSEAYRLLEKQIMLIQSSIERVVEDVTRRANVKVDEDVDYDDVLTRAISKKRGMAAEKAELSRRETALRAAQSEEAVLPTFIRLVDIMVVEQISQIIINSVDAFLRSISDNDAVRKGSIQNNVVFTVKVAFKEGVDGTISGSGSGLSSGSTGIVFSPTRQEVVSAIDQVAAEAIKTCAALPRILYAGGFRSRMQLMLETITHAAATAPTVSSSSAASASLVSSSSAVSSIPAPANLVSASSIVQRSPAFVRTQTAIEQRVRTDFASAERLAASAAQLIPVHAFLQSIDPQQGFSPSDSSPEGLNALLYRLSGWQQLVSNLRAHISERCIYVALEGIRGELEVPLQQALDRARAHAVSVAVREAQAVMETLKAQSKLLQQRPVGLAAFAAHMRRVNQEVRAAEASVNSAAAMADSLWQVLTANRVRVPLEKSSVVELMHQTLAAVSTDLRRYDDFVDATLPEMTRSLESSLARAESDAAAVAQAVSASAFCDGTRAPAEVLPPLLEQERRMAEISAQAAEYAEWARLFGLAPHIDTQSALDVSKVTVERRVELWRALEALEALEESWLSTRFAHLDLEQLATDVQQRLKQAMSLDKILGDSSSQTLKAKLLRWKSLLPAVLDLGNKALKERHIAQIFLQALGTPESEIPAPAARSIQYFLSVDLLSHADVIAEISAVATGEALLEQQIASVQATWAATEVPLKSYRETKNVHILGGLEDITALLEHDQTLLQNLAVNRYAGGVLPIILEWDARLSLLSDTFDEWAYCQKQWMYLESIFSADDIKKQLPLESTVFSACDAKWREVMLAVFKTPVAITALELNFGPVFSQGQVTNAQAQTGTSHPWGSDFLLLTFRALNKSLEKVQKSLEEYLETKRLAFPRFFFLSNDELLTILSQTKDPRAVQPHLIKCFDAIKSVEFNHNRPLPNNPSQGHGAAGANTITAMVSPEGEKVPFSGPLAVSCAGNVEDWLRKLEENMRLVLRESALSAVGTYPSGDRSHWLFQHPAQIVILVDQIVWTRGVTEAIQALADGSFENSAENPLKKFYDSLVEQLSSMVALVRGDLSRAQRTLLGALSVIDVHARDITGELIQKGIHTTSAYDFTKLLRYYFAPRGSTAPHGHAAGHGGDLIELGEFHALQTNARINYRFEFLGNSDRLVITPLTDQCYITLTGALHLRLGGAPAGPAGTGKTETTKDLARAVAFQCVVFNCSDGLDYKIMGKFFSGLAQSGAWACFDEFNRIDVEVLSVIAQQMITIQQGLFQNAKFIHFCGRDIPLSPHFGVFITMNPGYAGRSELPDNLKALFRPVAMMVPDYRLIAEIILLAQGYSNATTLASKLTQLYKLSSEQLSKQGHYDFGMRAVKSVLLAAGVLKRKEPEAEEQALLIRALSDANVPKFLSHDIPLFQGILTDLFPSVQRQEPPPSPLDAAVGEVLRAQGFLDHPAFRRKVMQLHETQMIRHGVMLVGDAGSGKSTALRALAQALTLLGHRGEVDRENAFAHVTVHVMNPKSSSMVELFGYFNELSQEWKDGLVASVVRNAIVDSSITTSAPAQQNHNSSAHSLTSVAAAGASASGAPPRTWVVFDGPVDAIWIENMNTVLDDNKLLCLSNGERIKLPASMHMLFEVADLAVASPATVSRCGMVFMEPANVGVQALLHQWAQGEVADLLPNHVHQLLARLTDQVPLVLEWLRNAAGSAADDKKLEVIPTQELTRVSNVLGLLTALLSPSNGIVLPGAVEPLSCAQKAKDLFEKQGSASQATQLALAPTVPAAHADRYVDLSFVLALAWGMGGSLLDERKRALAAFIHDLNADMLRAHGFERDPNPNKDLFNVWLPYNGASAPFLRPFSEVKKHFEYAPSAAFADLFVPTDVTTAYASLLTVSMRSGRGVLLVGDSGVGKSRIFRSALQDLDSASAAEADNLTSTPTTGAAPAPTGGVDLSGIVGAADKYSPLSYNVPRRTFGPGVPAAVVRYSHLAVSFSAQTSPALVFSLMEKNLEKRRKTLLAPPQNKRLNFFVDDVNLPAVETYGAQPALEALRQIVDSGGFYDKDRLFFKSVQHVVLFAACAPPGGGRNPVPPRLLRRFHQLLVRGLDAPTMESIFGSILSAFSAVSAPDFAASVPLMVRAAVKVFTAAAEGLRPTPSKLHYTFNLRDVSKVFHGFLDADIAILRSVQPVHEGASLTASNRLLAPAKLLAHEMCRSIRDRLVDAGDLQFFDETVASVFQQGLGVSPPSQDAEDAKDDAEKSKRSYPLSECIFSDFQQRQPLEARLYNETTTAQLSRVLELFQTEMQQESQRSAGQRLVFFEDAVRHVAKICRILRQSSGSALLLGVGGSGRRSLTRLAAFICESRLFEVEVSRQFGFNEWRESLKKMIFVVGLKAQSCTFLFNESQAVHPVFMEDINGLLSSGEVPGLLQQEDVEYIVSNNSFAAGGPTLTRAEVMDIFLTNVRRNLHIVLCVSPFGASYKRNLLSFPSFVNCCSVIYFSAWPFDALVSVALRHLSRTAGTQYAIEAQYHQQVAEILAYMHESVRETAENYKRDTGMETHVTPASFLSLLQTTTGTYQTQTAEVSGLLAKYRHGLRMISDTNTLVDTLKKKLIEIQPVLKRSSEDTAALLVTLEQEQQETDLAQQLAATEEAACLAQSNEVRELKEKCQKELDDAQPILADALAAAKELEKNKASIGEMRSYTNPKPSIIYVMQAVCILFDYKPTWEDAKRFLSQSNVVSLLLNFDKDNIDPRTIKKLAKFIADPDFVPANFVSVSLAAKVFCQWVRAICSYDSVLQTIAPLRASLAAVEEKLRLTNEQLDVKRKELALLQEKVRSLRARYKQSTDEQARLLAEQRRGETYLERAAQLLGGLGSEGERWTSLVGDLDIRLRCLVGNSLLLSGMLSYLGPYSSSVRAACMRAWCRRITEQRVLLDSEFSFVYSLVKSVDVRAWAIAGLSTDDLTLENAVLAVKSPRWPLLLDPQGLAKDWVRNMYAGLIGFEQKKKDVKAPALSLNERQKLQRLIMLKTSDPDLMKHMEQAVRTGACVLLELVGNSIDAALDPILLKQFISSSSSSAPKSSKGSSETLRYIKLGDHEVPYDPLFRLYVVTKTPSKSYPPDLFVRLNVVDFATTLEGLRNQFLLDTVKHERPELEQRRDRLVLAIDADNRMLSNIEEMILNSLSESDNSSANASGSTGEGTILDNVALIKRLADSKVTSLSIAERVKDATVTRNEIQRTRNNYTAISDRAAILFSVISSLSKLDPMYQYSLPAFRRRFIQRLAGSARSDDVRVRTRTVVADITDFFIRSTVLSIFEQHKFPFVFALTGAINSLSVDPAAGTSDQMSAESMVLPEHTITPLEWNSFLSFLGTPTAPAGGQIMPEHLTTSLDGVELPLFSLNQWNSLCLMDAKFPHLKLLQCISEPSALSLLRELLSPSKEDHLFQNLQTRGSSLFSSGLRIFESLFLARCLRESSILSASRAYVAQTLSASTEAPLLDLAEALAEADTSTPVLIMLASGADSTESLLKLAKKHGKDSTLGIVSLGQGQGAVAEHLLQKARASGAWVVLQNCHLCLSWLPRLEEILESWNTSASATPGTETGAAAPVTQCHPDFRLWLTSMPVSGGQFPVNILRSSVVVTMEPPSGVRSNIKRCLASLTQADWETPALAPGVVPSTEDVQEDVRHLIYHRLLLSLSYYHSILLERRNFGPLGWNIHYLWMDSDFKASQLQIRDFMSRIDRPEAVPLETLLEIVSSISYGGRITDAWDRRTSGSLLRSLFVPELFHASSFDLAGAGAVDLMEGLSKEMERLSLDSASSKYSLPLLDTLAEASAWADSLPTEDASTLFGLHSNAAITLLGAQCADFSSFSSCLQLADVKEEAPADPNSTATVNTNASSSSGGRLTSMIEQLKKDIPPLISVRDAHPSTFAPLDGVLVAPAEEETIASTSHGNSEESSSGELENVPAMSPMGTFLQQEVQRYNALISSMNASLRALELALGGLTVMSPSLEALLASLQILSVPKQWADAAYPSLKPLPVWLQNLRLRVNVLRDWVRRGPPVSYWISGFFFPQGFLTACLQVHARRTRLPIDTLGFRSHLTPFSAADAVDFAKLLQDAPSNSVKTPLVAPSTGVLIHGLFLVGAAISELPVTPGPAPEAYTSSKLTLVESKPGVLITKVPIIYLEPLIVGGADHVAASEDQETTFMYACPMYKTSQRAGTLSTTGHSTNFVTTITIPSKLPEYHWVRRGVAMISEDESAFDV